MWKIDEPSRRPGDEDRYESWTTMARREDGKCAFGFAATKEQAEECLKKDIARIEEFESLAPMAKLERIFEKKKPGDYLLQVDITDAVRAIYEELKNRK